MERLESRKLLTAAYLAIRVWLSQHILLRILPAHAYAVARGAEIEECEKSSTLSSARDHTEMARGF